MYLKIFILLFLPKLYFTQVCNTQDFINITDGVVLPNKDIQFDGKTYTDQEYVTDETGSIKACKRPDKPRIRKCCPIGTGYDFDNRTCVNLTEPFNPPVMDNYYAEMTEMNVYRMFDFEFGKHKCKKTETNILISVADIPVPHIKQDGQLYMEMTSSIPAWKLQTPDKYCIDTFVHKDNNGNPKTRVDAIVCFTDEKVDDTTYIFTSACMLISCVFILATVAVYSWLPELRNLHGRVLMAYLLCLFVGFIFLSTMKILVVIEKINKNICVVLTFFIYFFLLSSFFWLNVMSFDIWWTFSGKRGLSLEKSINHRFGAYALYAFGIPVVLTIIMASLEFSGLPNYPLMPNIRQLTCFLYGKSRLLYLYGPMVVLCLANTIFFVLTATKIAQIKQQTTVLQSKESSTHNQQRKDQQRLLLYVKLFIVMGISWILEVVSALYPDEAKGLWWVTDAYNVLTGLTIFVIFVCKRKIFELIKKRMVYGSH